MSNSKILSAIGVLVIVFSFASATTVRAADLGDGGIPEMGFGGGYDYVDTYYPTDSGYDYVDTYYPTDSGYDYVDTYYPTDSGYDYVDTYYPTDSGYDYVDTYYPADSGYDYVDTYYPTYSSTPSYGGGYSTGGGYTIPRMTSYPSYPTTIHAPTYQAPRQQQQQQQQQQGGNTVIHNTNNNTNVNNNNSSAVAIATVTNVTAAPVQYPVTYVQPPVIYQPPVYHQPPVVYSQPQPYCTISISNYNNNAYGQYGSQLATLTWSSSNATSGHISPNVGTVSSYGSMTVYPVSGQTYTMTVYGPGGSANCSTPNYYVPVVNNPTPYVSLSQIPYTGLDMGPLGQAMYWLSLVVFAGAASYLVLYFNGGVLAFARGRSARQQVVEPKIQMPTVSAAKTPAPAPIVTAEAVVSPIQIPFAPEHKSTADSMVVKHSKAGEAPRIIITRV
jgi:hypothetical protein